MVRVFIDVTDSYSPVPDAIEKEFESTTEAIEWCKENSTPDCTYHIAMSMTVELNY